MASLKEGDRVRVGREVLVWHRKGGKHIREELLGGRKKALKIYLMKLCLKL